MSIKSTFILSCLILSISSTQNIAWAAYSSPSVAKENDIEKVDVTTKMQVVMAENNGSKLSLKDLDNVTPNVTKADTLLRSLTPEQLTTLLITPESSPVMSDTQDALLIDALSKKLVFSLVEKVSVFDTREALKDISLSEAVRNFDFTDSLVSSLNGKELVFGAEALKEESLVAKLATKVQFGSQKDSTLAKLTEALKKFNPDFYMIPD
ncbi:MAG: hypothetical protein FJX03_05020 [Alphaproteobacteria bacterium]|nr:hypothetical protein [Alphaproteobacteria bacterium]